MEILIIKISLALIFTLAVIGKLTGMTKSTFIKSGYNIMLMYATATCEALFTIMLFTKFELIAIIGLLTIIIGAILTLGCQKAKPHKFILAITAFILLIALFFILIF